MIQRATATAYEAAQRSRPVSEMEDLALVAFALGGDDEANWREIYAELLARGRSGNLHCQRAVIGIATALLLNGRCRSAAFVAEIEPVARQAALSGQDSDLLGLARVLSIKAAILRGNGAPDPDTEAETLTIIGTVAANSGSPAMWEDAARDYRAVAAWCSDAARTDAEADLWLATLRGPLTDEPEVAALKRAKGEE